MSNKLSNHKNFTPDPSAPCRRDYAREYAGARNRASNISARSNEQQSCPSAAANSPTKAHPRSEVARLEAQPQRQRVKASQVSKQLRSRGPPGASRAAVQPHLPMQKRSNLPLAAYAPQKYFPKAEYKRADFEAIPFRFTDEIAHRLNHAWWLTDPRNIPEPWAMPSPPPAIGRTPTAGIPRRPGPGLIQPPSTSLSAVVAPADPSPRMQKARPQLQAMPSGQGTSHMFGVRSHSQPASAQTQ